MTDLILVRLLIAGTRFLAPALAATLAR